MNKSLRNKFIVLTVLVVAIFVLDIVTKYVVDGLFEEGTGVSLPLFNIISVHNEGAAWGIFEGSRVMLIVLSLVFLAVFIWYFIIEKNKSWLFIVTFAFIFAGCLGNLYDRLVFGYVRDFIQFAFWQSFPVFNFADTFLTIGIAMLIIYLIIPLFKKKSKKKEEETTVLSEQNGEQNKPSDHESNEIVTDIGENDENIENKG